MRTSAKDAYQRFALKLFTISRDARLSGNQFDSLLEETLRRACEVAAFLERTQGQDLSQKAVREALKRFQVPSLETLVAAVAQTTPAPIGASEEPHRLLRGIPEKFDSKFRFVLVAAERAEQLMRGARPRISVSEKWNAISTAMEEVLKGLVDWDYGPAPLEEGIEAGLPALA